jgi:hypothetical protein
MNWGVSIRETNLHCSLHEARQETFEIKLRTFSEASNSPLSRSAQIWRAASDTSLHRGH